MKIKYNNLNIQFTIEQTKFSVLNIVCERLTRSIPKHRHSNNSYELHYISQGYGTAIINDVPYEITPNTFYITGPNIDHEQESIPDNPMVEYCIYMNIECSYAKDPVYTFFVHSPFALSQNLYTLYPLIQQLIKELEHQEFGYVSFTKSLLQQIIVTIIRECKSIHKNKIYTTTNQSISKASNLFDQKFLIIEECFLYEYKTITLIELSKHLGLSPRQTERLLKEHYGKTFMQKKYDARMSTAAMFLKDPSKKISSIADDLGYSSIEHFSNAFKRYYHCSASQYRKQIQTK